MKYGEFDISEFNICDEPDYQYRIQHFKKVGTGINTVWRATISTPAGHTLVSADLGYIATRCKDSQYPMNRTNVEYMLSIIKDTPETLPKEEEESFTQYVRNFIKVKSNYLHKGMDAIHLGDDFIVLTANSRRQFKKLRKKMEKESYNNPKWTPACSSIDKIVKMHRMAIYNIQTPIKTV